jgi:hypothetical protein
MDAYDVGGLGYISGDRNDAAARVAPDAVAAPSEMALAAASNASGPRAAITTLAPDATNCVAIARPSPLLPPVTIAERP